MVISYPTFSGPYYHFPERKPVMWGGGIAKESAFSFTIKADDLTDNLIMRVVSVNGKNVNSGYIDIHQESVTLTGQRGR
jgi:hypothetical protein